VPIECLRALKQAARADHDAVAAAPAASRCSLRRAPFHGARGGGHGRAGRVPVRSPGAVEWSRLFPGVPISREPLRAGQSSGLRKLLHARARAEEPCSAQRRRAARPSQNGLTREARARAPLEQRAPNAARRSTRAPPDAARRLWERGRRREVQVAVGAGSGIDAGKQEDKVGDELRVVLRIRLERVKTE
jgi:hypothetical protein